MLSVEDLDRSIDFYRALLGGIESYRFPTDAPPVFVVLQVGTTDIGLGKITSESPLHGQPVRPAPGHRIELCVYLEDVDDTVERMGAVGVSISPGESELPTSRIRTAIS
jgi:lactoylglutathione lyase